MKVSTPRSIIATPRSSTPSKSRPLSAPIQKLYAEASVNAAPSPKTVKLQKQVEELQERFVKATEIAEEYRCKNVDLQTELDAEKEANKKLKRALREQELVCEEVERDLLAEIEKRCAVDGALKESIRQKDEALLKVEEITMISDNEDKLRKKMDAEIAVLRKEVDRLREQVLELESSCEQHKDKISQMEQTNKQLQALVHQKSSEVSVAKQEIVRKDEEIENLNKIVDAHANEIVKSERMNRQRQQAMKDRLNHEQQTAETQFAQLQLDLEREREAAIVNREAAVRSARNVTQHIQINQKLKEDIERLSQQLREANEAMETAKHEAELRVLHERRERIRIEQKNEQLSKKLTRLEAVLQYQDKKYVNNNPIATPQKDIERTMEAIVSLQDSVWKLSPQKRQI